MSTQLSGIMRGINRDPNKPLNILTGPTHHAYETNLCRTGHNFYALYHETFIKHPSSVKMPDNYIILPELPIEQQLKPDIVFDLILSQNKFSQFQILSQLNQQYQVCHINIEHTIANNDPKTGWTQKRINQFTQMSADVNIFISKHSRDVWGFDDSNGQIILHGIDTKKFCGPYVGDDKRVLTVVNDFANREWCCGFNLYRTVTQGLPVSPVGDTPGLSESAKNTDDLIEKYRHAAVFLNTSLWSPVPMALLEAMAVGVPIVTTATCMMPDIIQNGTNGFITNDPKELRQSLIAILQNPELGREMGEKGRQTVIDMFGLDRFVSEWNEVLIGAAGMQRKF